MSDARDKGFEEGVRAERVRIREVVQKLRDVAESVNAQSPMERAMQLTEIAEFEALLNVTLAEDAAVATRPVPDREAVARVIYDMYPSRHPGTHDRFDFGHASANNERGAAYRAADAILSLLTPDTNPTTEED